MKVVVQRVKEAMVKVEGLTCGAIGKGMLLLLGVHRQDTLKDTSWMVNKIVNLRFFSDEDGKMNRSVKDIHGEILVVSQFTLYGNCVSGRRPDFLESAPPNVAIPIYEKFVSEIKQEIGNVQTGKFGASMEVSLINEGPVTLIIEK